MSTAIPLITVMVVNYRTPDLALRCLEALRQERASVPDLTVMIVDGGSGDGSVDILREGLADPRFAGWADLLPLAVNGGFGWANNQGILTLAAEGRLPEFVHILNPDTEVRPGAIPGLIRELRDHPECGAAGSQLFAEDGHRAASAFRFPSAGRELTGHAQSAVLGRLLNIPGIVIAEDNADPRADWVSGASVMFRTEALREVGLFDDGFFLYFEEVELMHRLNAGGWSVRHVPASEVMHKEGASTSVGAGFVHRPFPPYWYQSRRRYFEMTGGTSSLLVANFCALVGHGLAWLKASFRRARVNSSFRTGDLIRFGLSPTGRRRKSLPSLTDVPGQMPTWKAAR